ncbi:MAG: hypothetical protein D6820_16360 [Lentisphaerae bacterium]|nr:MAG: hypothetical protein D6820_16360 [Lentisphaerota bacterium]
MVQAPSCLRVIVCCPSAEQLPDQNADSIPVPVIEREAGKILFDGKKKFLPRPSVMSNDFLVALTGLP